MPRIFAESRQGTSMFYYDDETVAISWSIGDDDETEAMAMPRALFERLLHLAGFDHEHETTRHRFGLPVGRSA